MLLKHSLYYLMARGVPGLASFLAIALFTRLLSPGEYGQYALVLAASGLAYTVLFSWLPLGLLRFLPAQRETGQKEALLSAVLGLFWGLSALLVVGVAGFLLVTTLSGRGSGSQRTLWLLGASLLWTRAFYELNLELTRSSLSPARYGALSAVKVALSVGLGGLFAYAGLGANGLLLGSAAAFLVPAVVAARRGWPGADVRRADRQQLRQLAVYGVPLTATFALEFVVSGSDRLLLAGLLDVKAAGLYAVGYDLAKQSLTLLLMVVNLAAYPLAVHAFERSGAGAAERQLAQNFVLLLAVGLPATVGFGLLAPNLAGVLVGSAFSGAAAGLMPWIAAATLLAGLKAYYVDLSFQLSKKTRLQVLVALAAAVTNLLLNLWLIPRFGLYGAAYATLAAYAAALVGGWWLGNRTFPLPLPLAETAKVAAATLVMALALLPTRPLTGAPALALQVGLGAAVYLAALLLLNVSGSRRHMARLFGRVKAYVAERQHTATLAKGDN